MIRILILYVLLVTIILTDYLIQTKDIQSIIKIDSGKF